MRAPSAATERAVRRIRRCIDRCDEWEPQGVQSPSLGAAKKVFYGQAGNLPHISGYGATAASPFSIPATRVPTTSRKSSRVAGLVIRQLAPNWRDFLASTGRNP